MKRTDRKRAWRWLRWIPLVFAMGCVPTLPPCGTEHLAADVAACVVRMQTECKPLPDGSKDRKCPAFVECSATVDRWEACP